MSDPLVLMVRLDSLVNQVSQELMGVQDKRVLEVLADQ